MTYTIIRSNGDKIAFVPAGNRPTMEEMQKIVGGYIERVVIKGGEMYVNEEGFINMLPVNTAATSRVMYGPNRTGLPIVGDVLLCMRGKAEGLK